MSNREKLVRGGVQLLGGQAAVQFLSLARNFCIAKLISPEDFGVAATFALTLSMLEVIGDLSFHKLLIQDPEGEDPTLQAVLQSLTLIRGLLIGAAIFAAAEPIARIFGVPEAADAYRWLALAPVLKGFVHLDIYRLQRSLSFSVEVRLLVLAQAAAFIVAVALAWLWRDYMAVLWAVVAQAAVQGLGAHILAERSYRLRLKGAHFAKAFRFGWPLMLNGFVIMLATQGDRVLVGAHLTMTDLAVYTVAALLVSALQLPILKVTGTLALPWLAAVQGNSLFTKRYDMTSDALTVLALLVFLPLSLLGAQFIVLVFGAEYRAPATLVGWLAFGAALRVLRGGPLLGSLAVGDTKNLMLSNLVRSAGIFVAALALFLEGGLAAVAAAMCLGELAAYGLAMIRLGNTVDVPIPVRLRGVTVLVAAFLLALALDAALSQDATFLRVALAMTITIAAVLVTLWFSPKLLKQVRPLTGVRRQWES